MANVAKAPGLGMITASDYRKQLEEELESDDKCPAGCEECTDCGECKADLVKFKLRRQNSMVLRLGTRVQALLASRLSDS